ncbi:hypothetical protein SEA_BANQUO_57 [Gordonia phage Banquo]|uniref:Uncharacterized protein n=1 Tax=Gordonia phage TinaLin TaxID=2797324 RepID=A0A7T7GTF3_9CAUD|nr:hypothetical protein KDJ60_gp49 [Gordonia phage TinaLin]QQM15145.1 hypothetical protein SEA_TINALIN_57 [Gordonia phage TinaLin]URM87387.1 hypothetical protein SEA_BANQUO_57 [Gordonia phage Banquo]
MADAGDKGRAYMGTIGEPCKRYLTRNVKGVEFWLFCDRADGHDGPHAHANGLTWTTEGAWG